MFIVYIIRPFDEKRNILKVIDDYLTYVSKIVKMHLEQIITVIKI